MSSQAVARSDERVPGTNVPKDNWLGFVGDVLKFTGEVTFRSMLRIDGNFSGQVNSRDGTAIRCLRNRLGWVVFNQAIKSPLRSESRSHRK